MGAKAGTPMAIPTGAGGGGGGGGGHGRLGRQRGRPVWGIGRGRLGRKRPWPCRQRPGAGRSQGNRDRLQPARRVLRFLQPRLRTELIQRRPERHLARVQRDFAVLQLVLRVVQCDVVAGLLLEIRDRFDKRRVLVHEVDALRLEGVGRLPPPFDPADQQLGPLADFLVGALEGLMQRVVGRVAHRRQVRGSLFSLVEIVAAELGDQPGDLVGVRLSALLGRRRGRRQRAQAEAQALAAEEISECALLPLPRKTAKSEVHGVRTRNSPQTIESGRRIGVQRKNGSGRKCAPGSAGVPRAGAAETAALQMRPLPEKGNQRTVSERRRHRRSEFALAIYLRPRY